MKFHSTDAGEALVAAKDTFRTTLEPGLPEPEERLRAAPWAKT